MVLDLLVFNDCMDGLELILRVLLLVYCIVWIEYVLFCIIDWIVGLRENERTVQKNLN